MRFTDHELAISGKAGMIRVRLKASALRLMASDDTQPPEAVISANLDLIAELAAMTPAGADGVVEITAHDIEG